MTDSGETPVRPAATRCPLCRAAVRGSALCRRCGADLTDILIVRRLAWETRTRAREAFSAGRYAEAAELLDDALGLEEHPQARRLAWVARLLGAAEAEAEAEAEEEEEEATDDEEACNEEACDEEALEGEEPADDEELTTGH